VVRVLKNAVLEPSRPAAYCVSTVLCSLCMVLRVLLGFGWLWMYLAPVPLVLWFAFGVVVVKQRARDEREPFFFQEKRRGSVYGGHKKHPCF